MSHILEVNAIEGYIAVKLGKEWRMSIWHILMNTVVVLSFVLLNGFFVATEYAIVKVRSTQIEPLAKKGNLRAKIAKEILIHTNTYISATQLGITMTSLALGWIGEPLTATMLEPLFFWIGITQHAMIHAISFAVAFSIITAIHIIVGEQAPKVLAIQNSAPTILTVAYPIRLFYFLFRPIVLTLNASSNGLLHIIGLRSTTTEVAHSDEELRLILAHDKHITPVSRDIALKAMDFHQKQARHSMIPRKEIVALSADATVQNNLAIMMVNKFSRYPIFKETIDNIVGIIYTKDIFKHDLHHKPDFTLNSIIREAAFLPETATLEQVLTTILDKKTHMVILADEYGGTAGLITLENVLEELVGNIQDEYDREAPEVVKISENEYIVDGSCTTNDVERLFDTELSPLDIHSIGGFVIDKFGHFPKLGESIRILGLEFKVEKVVENVVAAVRVKRILQLPNKK